MKTLMICIALMMTLGALAQGDFRSADGVLYRVERYAVANFPVGMVFTPQGELLYSEKATGKVRYVNAGGRQQPQAVLELLVDGLQERGMQGMALDPDYENSRQVWLFYTASGTARKYPTNKVLRFRLEGGAAVEAVDAVEFFSLPIDTGYLVHNGGGLEFDAAGHLYVSIGDYGDPSRPQDLSLPHGKIHRFAIQDGRLAIPADNPFADSSVYAYGLRNAFGLAFDPLSGRLFATENGEHCDDELNLIFPAFNYGYRADYECAGSDYVPGLGRYFPPLLSYTPTIAPVGITFYDHPAIPQWRNDLFFCGWNDGALHHVRLNSERNKTVFDRKIELGAVRCRLDVAVGPDGAIYFGTVDADDGAIYRLLPLND